MFFTEIAKAFKHEQDTQYTTVVSKMNQKHVSIYIISVGGTIRYSHIFGSRTNVSPFGV